MPGPAPKDDVRRRNKKSKLMLPAEGRKGKAPAFPIKGHPVPAVWAELWSTPQAVAWEKLGWTRIIARYALLVTAAESEDAPMSMLAEVRQLEDRIGLSPMSMLRLEWAVADDEVSEKRSTVKRSDSTAEERRKKLRIVG